MELMKERLHRYHYLTCPMLLSLVLKPFKNKYTYRCGMRPAVESDSIPGGDEDPVSIEAVLKRLLHEF